MNIYNKYFPFLMFLLLFVSKTMSASSLYDPLKYTSPYDPLNYTSVASSAFTLVKDKDRKKAVISPTVLTEEQQKEMTRHAENLSDPLSNKIISIACRSKKIKEDVFSSQRNPTPPTDPLGAAINCKGVGYTSIKKTKLLFATIKDVNLKELIEKFVCLFPSKIKYMDYTRRQQLGLCYPNIGDIAIATRHGYKEAQKTLIHELFHYIASKKIFDDLITSGPSSARTTFVQAYLNDKRSHPYANKFLEKISVPCVSSGSGEITPRIARKYQEELLTETMALFATEKSDNYKTLQLYRLYQECLLRLKYYLRVQEKILKAHKS
jgi:hypothetical protein